MCRTWGSNSGPLACQAETLPIELPRPDFEKGGILEQLRFEEGGLLEQFRSETWNTELYNYF